MHNPNANDRDVPTGEAIDSGAEAATIMTVEIAHQFRELLTILLSSLEQLKRQSLDDRGRQQLERADFAARQISEIIDRVQPLS